MAMRIGFGCSDDNTWEPRENLDCDEMIDEFELQWTKKHETKGKKGRKEPAPPPPPKELRKSKGSQPAAKAAATVVNFYINIILTAQMFSVFPFILYVTFLCQPRLSVAILTMF